MEIIAVYCDNHMKTTEKMLCGWNAKFNVKVGGKRFSAIEKLYLNNVWHDEYLTKF